MGMAAMKKPAEAVAVVVPDTATVTKAVPLLAATKKLAVSVALQVPTPAARGLGSWRSWCPPGP
jgi:hypothetical protein